MKNEFIPYDEALAMEELGFNEPCYNQYTDGTLDLPCTKYDYPDCVESIPAPLYQQAFRWFRNKYNLLHIVNIDLSNNLKDKVYVYSTEDHLGSIVDRSKEYKTYEEAELACLKTLIESVLARHWHIVKQCTKSRRGA